MAVWEERAGRNEALFRAVNDNIAGFRQIENQSLTKLAALPEARQLRNPPSPLPQTV